MSFGKQHKNNCAPIAKSLENPPKENICFEAEYRVRYAGARCVDALTAQPLGATVHTVVWHITKSVAMPNPYALMRLSQQFGTRFVK
jgi:hypothetical protein